MTGYQIDAGIPETWVTVTPFGPSQGAEQVVAGFAIKCHRCGRLEIAYQPYIGGHRDWVRSRVEEHNRCAEQVAA